MRTSCEVMSGGVNVEYQQPMDELLSVPSPVDDYTETWRWALELKGASLRKINLVDVAMAQLDGLTDLHMQEGVLFTTLIELFNNALDHGVLGLSSELKASPEGSFDYYAERDKRLELLVDGYVRIELAYQLKPSGGRLIIRFEDSGKGFDYNTILKNIQTQAFDKAAYLGRGIMVLLEYCESLSYKGGGNRVEAVLAWRK